VIKLYNPVKLKPNQLAQIELCTYGGNKICEAMQVHKDEKDTYFKPCRFCLLLGIKPDGTRQNLQEWWESGGACPLGHWPAAEER